VDQITHSAFLDIAVGNPAAPTYRMDDRNDPITRWHFWGAYTHRHREKLAKYEPFTAATGLTITPLAMDATGRLGPHFWRRLLPDPPVLTKSRHLSLKFPLRV
jgi:hypothetical protein